MCRGRNIRRYTEGFYCLSLLDQAEEATTIFEMSQTTHRKSPDELNVESVFITQIIRLLLFMEMIDVCGCDLVRSKHMHFV